MKNLMTAVFALSFCFSAQAYELKFTQHDRNDIPMSILTGEMKIDKAYHTIASVEVNEIQDAEALDNVNYQQKGLGEVIMTIDKLLALGKKIWAIVEAGRPVAQTQFAPTVSVLPNTESPETAFYEMENWSMPRVKSFRVVYKNLLGMTVVAFTYGVYYQYDGTYKGKGKYLTGVNVDARDVKVSWGFEFNASSAVVAIMNRGSNANPNAGLTVKINYLAKSVLREIRTGESFHLTGKGEFARIQ